MIAQNVLRGFKAIFIVTNLILLSSCTGHRGAFNQWWNSPKARAGATYSNQKESLDYLPGDSNEDTNALIGFYAGLSGEIPINQKLSAVTGVDFSTKGSGFETGSSNKIKRRLSYIDVPVKVQYSLKPNFYFNGGLQPSFLVSARRKSDNNNDDIRDLYKNFDLAATIGARYDFSKNLGIQIQYDHGLTDISEGNSFEDVKNRTWRLGLMYSIKSW